MSDSQTQSDSESQPLISILIAASKPTHFAECLQSALAQTWDNLEIIVGDSSPGPEIEAITRRHSQRDARVRYHRDPDDLGGRLSAIKLYQESSGALIKFL